MPFFSVPPPSNSSRTSLSERKKSSYTTVSSSEPAMSVDENEKDHHSRSLKRGLSKRAKKVRRFFKRMGRHHRDEHDVDTLNDNLSSLDVANMTSTSSFRTTTTISTSSGGHDSLHDHDDNDDTPSHNTKDSKFSNDEKTTAAEQQEHGQSNHVDRQPTPTAAEEYGVSDTKQSRKPITASIAELTPPVSPTSATTTTTTSPPNSCYSIDRRVDDAVVDELSLRKNDHASYKQPQIIVSPSDSTPSGSTELTTNNAHQQQEQPSSPAVTNVETKDAAIADDSEDESTMTVPHTKENEQQVIDIKENHQEEEQVNKENTALEKAIQEPVAQQEEEEKKPHQKQEALTTIQEEKIQSASTKPAQTQGQEPYVISSSNDALCEISEDTSSHVQVEQHQHPVEKGTSSIAENDALTTQKEELAMTQGQLSQDQKASTTAPEEKQPSSLPLASVDEEETPIKETQEEEPIMGDQVSESSKMEYTDPATAAVKPDQEEHQPLLVTQEPSSTDAAATVIVKQDYQALDTTDNKEEISSAESNNEHKDTNSCSKTMTHTDHETSCKQSERQDNDAMSQRVAYFDKKHTGRISMLDTFTSLRGLGYHWLVAIPATFIVHLRLSPLTMPSHRPFSIKEYLLLPIYTERVAQALHTPILAAQRQRLGQWVQMYGQRHGNMYGLGFWGGFRALGAAESNSTTLRWWQLRSRMIHRLQWILTYTMLYDPNARMVTQPTLEGLCNRQLPS